MNILMRLQQVFPSLTNKEQEVAEYVLHNSSHVALMRIGELAEKTATSNATITRFCKKMGCENYVDFKLEIHAFSNPVADILPDEVSEQVYQYYSTVIRNTQSLIQKNKLINLSNW